MKIRYVYIASPDILFYHLKRYKFLYYEYPERCYFIHLKFCSSLLTENASFWMAVCLVIMVRKLQLVVKYGVFTSSALIFKIPRLML